MLAGRGQEWQNGMFAKKKDCRPKGAEAGGGVQTEVGVPLQSAYAAHSRPRDYQIEAHRCHLD